MRRIVGKIVICLIWIGLLAGPVLADHQPMRISVDPRMELLSVVQLLSGYGERGILTRYEMKYKDEILEYFAPYKDHKAVKTFARMSKMGFSYDAPPTAMLFLSNPPELKKEVPYTSYIKRRAGLLFGGWQLDQFVKTLRDFATVSHFMDFYNQHRDFYDRIIRDTEAVIAGEDYVKNLEDYYGQKQNSYHIILVPLFHSGGYGPRIERQDHTPDVYNIRGPLAVSNDIPNFGTATQFRDLAWHEFSHSFVNPLTDQYGAEVNRHRSLYNPISGQMKNQAYPDWLTAVKEHIVRAVTTRLTYIHFGEAMGGLMRNLEKERGFFYIDALLERLEEYENHRDAYPTFADFYPELIKAFAGLSERDLGQDFYMPPFGGTITEAIADKGAVVLIIPTNEEDKTVETKIREFVEVYRSSFFPTASIITDAAALEMDLSAKVPIVFGTAEGNLWIQRYIYQIPVTITADRIILGKTYYGERLQLITSWPNPHNPHRGMILYMAQRAEDVIDINYIFHGPTDFVIGQGGQALSSGNYY